MLKQAFRIAVGLGFVAAGVGISLADPVSFLPEVAGRFVRGFSSGIFVSLGALNAFDAFGEMRRHVRVRRRVRREMSLR